MTTIIDWDARVTQLRQLADDLELAATQISGRGKLVLGRAADELRAFIAELEAALADEIEEAAPESSSNLAPPPAWITDELFDDE